MIRHDSRYDIKVPWKDKVNPKYPKPIDIS